MLSEKHDQESPLIEPFVSENGKTFPRMKQLLICPKPSLQTFTRTKTRIVAVVVSCFVILLIYYSLIPKSKISNKARPRKSNAYTSCYQTPSTRRDSLQELRWDEQSESESTRRRNIFFLETSCSSPGSLELRCRQACAVESAALQNPNSAVRLLFVSPSAPSDRASLLLRQLSSYENVKVNRVDADEFVKGTPIERWFGSWIFDDSSWPVIDMADILRLVTIWKFGGIYLDLDFVVMKSLEDLDHFTVPESTSLLNNAVFGLRSDELGKKIASLLLSDAMRNLDHSLWGSIGPSLMTRVTREICRVQEVSEMTPERCSGFKILPTEEFYPIDYPAWSRLFTSDGINETMRLIEKSRGLHLWNALSGSTGLQTNQTVPYTILARRYCPLTYRNCGNDF